MLPNIHATKPQEDRHTYETALALLAASLDHLSLLSPYFRRPTTALACKTIALINFDNLVTGRKPRN
jgi:hypothetical protein